MSAKTKVSALDHAMQTAHTWVHDVAREFDTEDQEFAYRVLRARLHTLRDRLTMEASAHFAAQLPDLIRGIFYAGWNPSAVPEKYDAEAYAARFAREAIIAPDDVGKAAAAGPYGQMGPGMMGPYGQWPGQQTPTTTAPTTPRP